MRSAPPALAAMLLTGLLISACGGSSKPSTTSSSSTSATSQTSTATSTTQTTTAITGTMISPGVVRATSGPISATLHATTHKPRVNAAWPISFNATNNGLPARAEVSYEYLFNEAVVAKRSHIRFTGHFSDIFRWPPASVGYPLTFRAVILAAGRTIYLEYPVTVER